MDVTPEQCADILRNLADKLGSKELLTRLQPYMGKAFDVLRPKLAEYPGPRQGPMVFKSRKQFLFVMWMKRQGLIDLPYQRTNTLAYGWYYHDPKYVITDAELVGTLSNPASDWRIARPYGAFVQGEAQQPMHAGTWTKVEDVVQANRGLAVDEIARGVAEIAREALKT